MGIQKTIKVEFGDDIAKPLTFKELYDLMTAEIEEYRMFGGDKMYEELMNSKIEFIINDDDSLALSAKCTDLIGLIDGGIRTVIACCLEDILFEKYIVRK
ncbi:MAG: hypothetical protein RSC24_06340 [Clostridium sp.]